MDGRDFYGLFKALKLHYTQEKFNFLKYGKTKFSEAEFTKVYVLANYIGGKFKSREAAEEYLVALFSRKVVWLNEVLSDESKRIVAERNSFLAALEYRYEDDLKRVLKLGPIGQSVKCGYLQVPPVVQALLDGEIQPETLICLDFCFNFMGKVDDILWKTDRIRVQKYKPFFRFDEKRIASITRRVIEENME